MPVVGIETLVVTQPAHSSSQGGSECAGGAGVFFAVLAVIAVLAQCESLASAWSWAWLDVIAAQIESQGKVEASSVPAIATRRIERRMRAVWLIIADPDEDIGRLREDLSRDNAGRQILCSELVRSRLGTR